MATIPTAPMLLVSFHSASSTNPIPAYDPASGEALSGSALDTTTRLKEPRGLYLDSLGNLFVIDGDKHTSNVYFYPKPSSAGIPYGPAAAVITPATADSIDHPFAMSYVTGSGTTPGLALVSNQDTNVVASFDVTDPSNPTATPSKVASYLKPFETKDHFLKGTWVASAVGNLPKVKGNPPVVPSSKGGLCAKLGPNNASTADVDDKKSKEKVDHSVRDVALIGNVLVVVDEAASVVRLYEAGTGDYYGENTMDGDGTLHSPTHLLVVNGTVYVSSANQIYSGTVTTDEKTGIATLVLSLAFSLENVTISGMAVDPAGNFYFADRTGNALYS